MLYCSAVNQIFYSLLLLQFIIMYRQKTLYKLFLGLFFVITILTVIFLRRKNSNIAPYESPYMEVRSKEEETSDQKFEMLFQLIREQRAIIEELSCNSNDIGARGGFCLQEKNIEVGGNWVADFKLAKCIEENILKGESVGDFGAGLGWYGRFWLRNKNKVFKNASDVETKYFFQDEFIQKALKTSQIVKSWEGFDGAGNVQSLTTGFVKFLDLSQQQLLPKKFDWVVSLEVGEHIPMDYEETFINNLVNHACKGIVLSWARLGQGGHHHVNCRDNDYIKNEMLKRNFKSDLELEKKLRQVTSLYWFKDTLMVFHRITSLDHPHCNVKN